MYAIFIHLTNRVKFFFGFTAVKSVKKRLVQMRIPRKNYEGGKGLVINV